MTKTNKANTTLQNALVFNNRFATRTVNGEQIGIAELDEWKKLLNTLHRAEIRLGKSHEQIGKSNHAQIFSAGLNHICIVGIDAHQKLWKEHGADEENTADDNGGLSCRR